MKKGDLIWIGVIAIIGAFLIVPETREVFKDVTSSHPYMIGFFKFAILATMGELLARRISSKNWIIPCGIIFRAVIWGFIGMALVLVFPIFAEGVTACMEKGLLPFKGSKIAFALYTSTLMNVIFAPTMMGFHRITDTYIDIKHASNEKVNIEKIVNKIDWNGFVSFALLKTIPLFWIPAHTITFLLPPEYRILVAAFLSIALGIILSFSKNK